MDSLFQEDAARAFQARHSHLPADLALQVYLSRLIGQDRRLVLHGGGNTSVKLRAKNLFGEEEDLLYIKGSGLDLAKIEPNGFVGLRLDPLKKLLQLEALSDEDLDNELKMSRLSATAPFPSVETLLHVCLPYKFVDHVHADDILTLTNLKNGEDLIGEALGPHVAVLPYTMSGLPLAKTVVDFMTGRTGIEAIIFRYHGLFTFAQEARQAYEKIVSLVSRAEDFIVRRSKIRAPRTAPPVGWMVSQAARSRVAQTLRGALAHLGPDGRLKRFYIESRTDHDLVAAADSPSAPDICRSGVLTPDHVILTKNRMLFLDAVPETDQDLTDLIHHRLEDYRQVYRDYFNQNVTSKGLTRQILDPFPRLVLVAGLGLFGCGLTRQSARAVADIGEQTIRAKLKASSVGEYQPFDETRLFDLEYWPLEQKKLKIGPDPLLAGQVAVITGGGGAIAYGIADRVLNAGAVVVLADIDQARLEKVSAILAERHGAERVETAVFDVADFDQTEKAYLEISIKFGGIDLVVPNAGLAYVARLEELSSHQLDRVMNVNLKGVFHTIKAAIPIFRRQGYGANIVLISSKNVFDPGPAFGAYSASKAGAHQLAKIAALELAGLGVRVNMINPDAIFGDETVSSGLWDLVGPDRMKSRGLSPEGLRKYYQDRNLLKAEVLAEHVGNAVVFFASNQTPTTGASLPVDGGIPSAFPR